MDVSIVTTLYRSAPHLEEFRRRVVEAVGAVTSDFELVLVDDGSPDDSSVVARRFLGGDHRVKLVSLSRNYGHFHAIMTGLEHAAGELVFLIDCDLEEPPELFGEFYSVLTGARASDPIDVVYGIQRDRKGGWIERVTGGLFYRVFNLLSDMSVPRDAMIARLMTRRYVEALIQHRERELFILGVMTMTGFRQVGVHGRKESKGSSTYSLSKKLSLTVKAIASFSDKPLTAIFLVGSAISALAMLGILFLVVSRFAFGITYLVGWASLALLISFFGGMILMSLGVLGFYLGRVFVEVKARPTIVKDVQQNFFPESRPSEVGAPVGLAREE